MLLNIARRELVTNIMYTSMSSLFHVKVTRRKKTRHRTSVPSYFDRCARLDCSVMYARLSYFQAVVSIPTECV